MSLLVAAADTVRSAQLVGRVAEFEGNARASSDLEAVIRVCADLEGPDCVVCCDLGWAAQLVDLVPRLAVVLAPSVEADAELLLSALRTGVTDVWAPSMTSRDMHERLQAVRARAAAAASAVSRELSEYQRELERDQRAGRYVQLTMLPPESLDIGRYRVAHRIVPSMFMSGDFVDCFPVTDRHFVFYIADVSGHGAASAFVTVLLKDFSRRLAREFQPDLADEPGAILEWINRELLQQRIDKHVSMILGVADQSTDRIALVNGGHHPPVIRVSVEGPEFLVQKGKPVGLFDTVSYAPRLVQMHPGDRLVMFSDGVLDALGTDRLAMREARMLAAARAGKALPEIWDALGLDAIEIRKPDDMTCLVVGRES